MSAARKVECRSLVATVRLYSVGSTWFPDDHTVVAAHSAGAAKYRRWLDIRDSWEDCPITSMRAHVVKEYREPPGFRRCMEYRGIAFARIGMRVRFDDGREGSIVGHNGSANLDVLIDGEAQPSNCHPGWQITYLDENGVPIPRVPPPSGDSSRRGTP